MEGAGEAREEGAEECDQYHAQKSTEYGGYQII